LRTGGGGGSHGGGGHGGGGGGDVRSLEWCRRRGKRIGRGTKTGYRI